MTYAPIVLFTYNRLVHTQKTIEYLSQNIGAQESDLIIFSDGGKHEHDWEHVYAVREYLKHVQGFRSVHIIERDCNWGLAASVIAGVTDVIDRYGKIIVLEDDMITSPYFLSYMNDTLTRYEHNDTVGSVHAYVFPILETLPETFFLYYGACWGWGTWARAWKLFERDGSVLLRKIIETHTRDTFDFHGTYPFFRMLQKQILGKVDSWAIRWQASLFVHKKLTLWPGRSLIRNTGHDSSGVHSGSTALFDVSVSQTPILIHDIPDVENILVRNLFEKYFKSLKKRYISPRFIFYKILKKLRVFVK